MASHGKPRTNWTRTAEQKQQALDKIKEYRDLEEQVRSHIADKDFSPEAFQLTSKLLRLNPEYYTIWNVRRRLLIFGLLSKLSDGSWPSKASPSSSPSATTTTSSAAFSSSSLTATPPNPECRTTGKNGTIADTDDSLPGARVSNNEETKVKGDREKDLNVLQSELAFTIPLLMEFPKCYWIWDYRMWLLQQAIDRLEAPVARRIWEEELALDTKMLVKDRRNFHAWGYRRHVVKQLESADLNGKSMVEPEFEYTTKMIRADLSNFSAWHNRSKLIPRLLDERVADDAARKSFFDEELGLIRDALNVGPEDQSLWYYHQFLMMDLVDHVGRPTIIPGINMEERVTYVTREIDDIKDLLEDYDDSKLIYEALIDYTLALSRLEERQPTEEESNDLKIWLAKLQELDPMRCGRWNDMEKELRLR